MGRAKYVVELAEEERVRLRSLLRGGKASVRMVTRARVLLKTWVPIDQATYDACRDPRTSSEEAVNGLSIVKIGPT